MTISTENGRYSIDDNGIESSVRFERYDGVDCHISTRDRGSLLSKNIGHVLSVYGNRDPSDMSAQDMKTVYEAVRANIQMMGRTALCGDTTYSYTRRTDDGSGMFRLEIKDDGEGGWEAVSDENRISLQPGTTPDGLLADIAGGERMQGFKLLDYQKEAAESTEDMWEKDGKKRLMVEMATGTGKTVLASELIRRHVEKGGNVLFLAHTRDLVDQSARSLAFHMPEADIGIEMGRDRVKDIDAPDIVVATMQSMSSRLDRYPEDHFGMVVIDEAHHSECDSYLSILARFPGARVLGITATPDRTDEKGRERQKQVWEATSYRFGLKKAVEKGRLSPVKVLKADMDAIDLNEVQVNAASMDYAGKSLANRLRREFSKIAVAMTKQVRRRRPAVFLPTKASAREFAGILEKYGWNPVEIDSDTPDRKDRLDDFRNGKFDVIVSVDALREGFDCPSIDCIVPLRPTFSSTVYLQMVGRGTRLCPERAKNDCLILDFLWKDRRPGLFRPADIYLDNPQEEAERAAAEKILSESKKPISLSEIAQQARQKVLDDRKPKVRLVKQGELGTKRDRNLLRSLDGRVIDSPAGRAPVTDREGRQVQPVSPSDGTNGQDRFFSVNDYVLLTGMPSGILFAGAPYGKGEAVTPGQKEALQRAQIDWRTVKDKSQAAALIGYSRQRLAESLATPRMLHRLKEVHGFDGRVEGWSFNSARKVLDMLRENRVGRLGGRGQDEVEKWLVDRLREEFSRRR